MQKVIGLTLAMVPWLMTILKLGTLRRRHQDKQVVAVWLFFLFGSISLTLHMDWVGMSLDSLIGVTNLSWLLNYLAAMSSLFFLSASFYTESGIGRNRWMLPSTVVTAGLLVLVYLLRIAHLPENAEHVPYSVWELLFKELIYMYNGTVAAIVLQIAHRMNDRRDTISIRLKLAIVQVAAFFSTSFYTIKFVSTFVDFLVPSLLIIELLLSLAQLLQLGSILTWPLFFAPNELILKLTSPWLTMRKLGIIWDLKKLDDKLTRLCPPDTPGPIKRRQLIEGLRDLDMQLYRLVINILDNKKNLEDQLKGKTFPDSIKWSSWETSEAAELHRILGIIPKDQDFDGLVTTLREIATGKV